MQLQCVDCLKPFPVTDGFFSVDGDDICAECAATTHEQCEFCELFCKTTDIDIEGLCPNCHKQLKGGPIGLVQITA